MPTWFESLATYFPGPWLYALIVLAAGVEYVVPVLPGDSVLVLALALAAGRSAPAWTLWLAATSGCLLGASAAYGLGRLGQHHDWRQSGRPMALWVSRWVERTQSPAVRRKVTRNASTSLLLHRILPAMRAVVLVAAGFYRIPLPKTLALAGVASLVWCIALERLVLLFTENLEVILHWIQRLGLVSWFALAAAALGLLLMTRRLRL